MEVAKESDKDVLISVQNFTKQFGKKIIHDNLRFELYKGECLGLLGGSGAGKSVVLRSLIGLERPDKGEIIYRGKNIAHYTERQYVEVRKNVAYVFQYGALFDSLTVFDNIAYALVEHTKLSPSQIKDKVFALLSEFDLDGIENLFPSQLSGGMQKRVGLARALILEPEIVLYDEPTAGLDPANTVTIQNLILQLKKGGSTSVLVTHDIDTAMQVCDRICILKNRSIYEIGRVADLKGKKDVILNHFIKGEK